MKVADVSLNFIIFSHTPFRVSMHLKLYVFLIVFVHEKEYKFLIEVKNNGELCG